MWPSLNLLRISALTLTSLAIGSFFSDENGSSRTRKTYGKAIHLSIAKKPPRFHGRKRRLPSSEAGHVGLPAYKIALTYAPRDSLRSSSDSGNLTCLWKCHGIYIGGWSMMTDIITSWKRGPSAVIFDYQNVLALPYWLKEVSLDTVDDIASRCKDDKLMDSQQAQTSLYWYHAFSCLATFINVHPRKSSTLNIFAPKVMHWRKMMENVNTSW
jgi:hypothetical protein